MPPNIQILVFNDKHFSISADMGAMTLDEHQSPLHYAAKNDATASLKMLLKLGAFINDRDYKMRSPLFVAAETGEIEKAVS